MYSFQELLVDTITSTISHHTLTKKLYFSDLIPSIASFCANFHRVQLGFTHHI